MTNEELIYVYKCCRKTAEKRIKTEEENIKFYDATIKALEKATYCPNCGSYNAENKENEND